MVILFTHQHLQDFYYYPDKQKNQKTLHSVFGKCIESKLNSID